MGKNPNRKGIGGRGFEKVEIVDSTSDSALEIDASN
jgi:hypothetical protein